MIHMLVMKCLMISFTILVGLPLLCALSLDGGVGVRDLKVKELDVLCTTSTALVYTSQTFPVVPSTVLPGGGLGVSTCLILLWFVL
jgi:hypothetical protein